MPGDYAAVVTVNGGTFKRQSRSKFRLHSSPLTFSSEPSEQQTEIRITAQAEPDLVEFRSLTGLLVISGPHETTHVYDLPAFVDGVSKLSVDVSENGLYKINAHVLGRRRNGQPIKFGVALPDHEVTGVDVRDALVPEVADASPAEFQFDWKLGGTIVAAGNAVIGLLLVGVWLLYGRRKHGAAKEVVIG